MSTKRLENGWKMEIPQVRKRMGGGLAAEDAERRIMMLATG
jgi:hypothetical protein